MHHRTYLCALLLALVAACAATQAAEGFIWWEGEDAREANFPAQSAFSPKTPAERDVLSGGAWLSRDNASPGRLFAKYDVAVPRAGQYELWVRKFWKHGPFRWRFDEGPWQECGRNISLADSVELRPLVVANWVRLGGVALAEGRRVFHIELLAETGAACFDCFLLAPGPFRPRGKLKPGAKYGRAPEGWFPFEPDRDEFKESVLDLRRLNESEAGSMGFLQARGKDLFFERGNGPVRFWGVTAINDNWRMNKEAVDYLARRLAKVGVNLVRLHIGLFDDAEPSRELADIHYFVAAMKRQGIYTGFNFYCLAGAANVKPGWDLPEFENGYRPFSVLFFYPRLQERYRSWAKCLFTTINPHTGLSLAQDPAAAYVELVDEDNYFFWTFKPYETVHPKAMPVLEKKFGDWLKTKYGSLDKAGAAWGEGKYPNTAEDDFETGRVALYPAGALTGADWAVNGRNEQRARDQAQFLTEDLRNFWADTASWFHNELGFKGLVISTNWKTADRRVLDPLDQYANMGCDATARNTYFSGPARGPRAGYSISDGDRYTDRCLLLDPESAIMMHVQYAGYPHFMTEGGWSMPNRYRADGPFMMAAYGSLQGMDGWLPFVLERDWIDMEAKWPIQTPVTLGQFPAAALIYRNGYVKEGPVAINEALGLSDLYQLKGGAISQPMGLDATRAADVPPGAEVELDSLGSMDSLAFYVGRVIQTIGERPGKSSVLKELPQLIDRDRKVVKSATGQLLLDYGGGLATLNAPCAQGATGFLKKAGKIELDDVTIESGNEYGTVLVVSMDGRPLKESGTVLVQVMTEEQNYGWKTRAEEDEKGVEWKVIEDVGGPPIVVRKFGGTVSLRRPDARTLKVLALDVNGYRRDEIPGAADGAVTINLLGDCLYYVIQK